MATVLIKVLLLSLLAAPPTIGEQEQQRRPDKHDALKSIESTRGGRHWVDAKTDPPKSPRESQKCFQIEPGLRIELVAAEPLVMDPVSIAFDHRGRMFVVEYGDYPTGPAKKEDPPLSRVVVLEDADGDGRMDRRHVFADGLTFAHSLMAYQGGMLVGAQTEILFLKDTDGDLQADVRKVLFTGFTPAHPQMQIGNPRWGLDNWIYLNYGPGRITAGESVLQMPRKEFRFHPLSMQFGPASGLGQFGNTIDNFGRRFFCTNRNPIITAPICYEYLQRNPFAIIAQDQYDVGPSGGNTRVYPLVEMKSNYLSHAGTHTSACGTTAYRGDLLGAKYENSVFVCEPIGHLVTRSIVRPIGPLLTAQRARPKADFLASTDTWFRPASLATGPDGALYVADMYRLWVEHPKFLPEEIANRLDWRAGDDRGRIWRIVPINRKIKPQPFRSPDTIADHVAMLSDANGWRRQLAQRLLVERKAKQAAPQLRRVLRDGKTALTRLHALWTLDGLDALTPADVSVSLGDADVHVRRDAVSLATQIFKEDDSLLGAVVALADDQDARVRFQVALAVGETTDPRATETLIKLALEEGGMPWFATAILTSVKDRGGIVLAGMVSDSASAGGAGKGTLGSQHAHLVRQLATVAGARGDLDELAQLLTTIGSAKPPGVWWQTGALSGLATGVSRHRGALGRVSLQSLLAKPPKKLAASAAPVRAVLQRAVTITLDPKLAVADRVAAVELVSYQSFDQSAAVFEKLLASSQPVELQLAGVQAMDKKGNDAAAKIVLAHWPELGPKVRPAALDLLLRRTGATRQALQAMADGKINPAIVDIDRRVRLLRHGDSSIKAMAEKLFGGAVSPNRREVARQYAAALTMKASAEEGLKVFDRVCAKCHRIDGRGHEVGPDISDVRNRSREALLFDMLDPNQKLEPRFTEYIVVTDDGRIFNGLIVSENAGAVVLQQAEGKQQVISRNEIQEIRASGKSLMPEGVEKEVSVQQMADLLEYLKTRAVRSAGSNDGERNGGNSQ